MRVPSAKASKIMAAAATPVAVLIASGLVWQSSHAAFTGSTRNSGNNWATGSVALTDDDAGSARFQVTGMVPGQTETKCVAVTANASVPGVVKGYAVNPVPSPAGLEDRIIIDIKYGTGGGFGSCDGFVQGGVAGPEAPLSTYAQYNSYANALGAWSVGTGTQTRTYQITWRFDTAGMTQAQQDALQGAQTGIDLQWELQSS